MSDNKPTDSEIKKALDICSKSTNGCSHSKYTCEDCYLNGQPMCSSVLLQDAIDLINRLRAENRVKNYFAELVPKQKETIDKQEAEIERLSKKVDNLTQEVMYSDSITEMKVDEAKAKAYKEFAERLKTKLFIADDNFNPVVTKVEIDNLLKELVGDVECN